jgi:hypothetical protein
MHTKIFKRIVQLVLTCLTTLTLFTGVWAEDPVAVEGEAVDAETSVESPKADSNPAVTQPTEADVSVKSPSVAEAAEPAKSVETQPTQDAVLAPKRANDSLKTTPRPVIKKQAKKQVKLGLKRKGKTNIKPKAKKKLKRKVKSKAKRKTIGKSQLKPKRKAINQKKAKRAIKQKHN